MEFKEFNESNVMSNIVKRTIIVRVCRFNMFEKAFNGLVKIATNLGKTIPTYKVIAREKVMVGEVFSPTRDMVAVFKIELRYEEVTLDKWKLIAVLEKTGAGNIVWSIDPENPVDSGNYHNVDRCDHCLVTRERNKYYVVIDGTDTKVVGSSCMKKFFQVDPVDAMKYVTQLITITGDSAWEEEVPNQCNVRVASIVEIISNTVAILKNDGKYVRKYAAADYYDRDVSTIGRVVNNILLLEELTNPRTDSMTIQKLMNDPKNQLIKVTAEIESMAKKVLAKFDDYKDSTNTFEQNVYIISRQNVFNMDRDNKKINLLIGAVPYKMMAIEKEESGPIAVNPEGEKLFKDNVGTYEKLQFAGVVEKTSISYGNFGTSTKINVRSNGVNVSFFTNRKNLVNLKEGDNVKLNACVDKYFIHDVFGPTAYVKCPLLVK